MSCRENSHFFFANVPDSVRIFSPFALRLDCITLAVMPLPPPFTLRSLGQTLDASPDALGLLSESNELLDDPAALRARLNEDGYLYLRDFFPTDLILAGRLAVFSALRDAGELDATTDWMEGWVPATAASTGGGGGTFRPELAAASPEIQRVVFGPEILNFYTRLFGEPVRHFDFIWARLMGPGHGTATHCDQVYMGRGSERLLTCWIPYVDIPLEVGGLILLEKSHLQSERIARYLTKDVDAYCENKADQVQAVAKDGKWSFPGWLSQRPDTLPAKFASRWLTSELWRAGDFITFRMDLIHGSLDNQSKRLRFSTDTRYQPASHPADERWIGPNPPGHGLAGKRGRIC